MVHCRATRRRRRVAGRREAVVTRAMVEAKAGGLVEPPGVMHLRWRSALYPRLHRAAAPDLVPALHRVRRVWMGACTVCMEQRPASAL